MTTSEAPDVRLRADAARNRRSIIEAARQLYGRQGLNTPFDEIARVAGVGNATLYRHFPSRCALVAAAFAETLRTVVAAADRAHDDPDPWEGFVGYVRFLCELQATDRGIADLLTTAIDAAPELEELRAQAFSGFVRIADRARDFGQLRADFQPQDLVLLLMANAGLIHRTATAAPDAWSRLLSHHLDGLRASAATPAPPPPTPGAIQAAAADRRWTSAVLGAASPMEPLR
jgi:AcrR family transcriptional regulator